MPDAEESPAAPPASLRARLTAPGAIMAPFRYPAFRAIWTANLVSQLGSTFQTVGAAWLMTELTRSHTLIAAVQASTTAPILMVGLFAGAIADNYDRRRVMLVAQVAMLIASGLLAALTFAGTIGPYSLLLFTLLVGIGAAFNAPAWQASVRAQVGHADLPQAISMNTIAFNLARSAGPAIGGMLIAATGVATGFALNSISYIALIWVLMRWRPETPAPERRPMLPSIGAGLAYCWRSHALRRILTRGFFLGNGSAVFYALVPSLVRDRLHGGETTYGIVLAAFGIGSIVIAFNVSDLRRSFGTEKVIGGATVAFAAGMLGLALTQSLMLALPCAFVSGIAWTAMMTTLNVAMQVRSPEEILGRCLSTYQAVTFGAMSVGAWGWGMMSDAFGLGAALIGGAAWLVIAQGVLWIVAPMPAPHEGRVLPRG